jgi:hypothetical protein
MKPTLTIGGRQFKAVTQSTLRHDYLTQAQILKAGLHRLEMLAEETADEFALRVMRKAALDGEIFLLLGHLLMPVEREGKEWTPQMAEQTAEFLGNVTEPKDKAVLKAQIGSVLSSFFANGLSSLSVSLSSSQKGKPDITQTVEAKTTAIGTR